MTRHALICRVSMACPWSVDQDDENPRAQRLVHEAEHREFIELQARAIYLANGMAERARQTGSLSFNSPSWPWRPMPPLVGPLANKTMYRRKRHVRQEDATR